VLVGMCVLMRMRTIGVRVIGIVELEMGCACCSNDASASRSCSQVESFNAVPTSNPIAGPPPSGDVTFHHPAAMFHGRSRSPQASVGSIRPRIERRQSFSASNDPWVPQSTVGLSVLNATPNPNRRPVEVQRVGGQTSPSPSNRRTPSPSTTSPFNRPLHNPVANVVERS
jgi:hypothetical protein